MTLGLKVLWFTYKIENARTFFHFDLVEKAIKSEGSLQNDTCLADNKYKNLCVNTESFIDYNLLLLLRGTNMLYTAVI